MYSILQNTPLKTRENNKQTKFSFVVIFLLFCHFLSAAIFPKIKEFSNSNTDLEKFMKTYKNCNVEKLSLISSC